MNASIPWTVVRIKATKGHEKIACVTAYDYATARLVDEAGLPLMLVGDSLGMTVLGSSPTCRSCPTRFPCRMRWPTPAG